MRELQDRYPDWSGKGFDTRDHHQGSPVANDEITMAAMRREAHLSVARFLRQLGSNLAAYRCD